jgi:hypothetical protein
LYFHALGLYDNNNSYIVQKVYNCSDLTASFMVPRSEKIVTCIEWELKVEKEFDEHDLFEAQIIYIASHALTEYALLEWKHICRHKNIPQYWRGFKLLFTEAFIPAYYVVHLLAKLDNLMRGSSTVNEYYHEFKICVLFGVLEECKKDVMSRIMKGLNSQIQTMLIHETYSYIDHMFLLARIAEKQIS